MSDTLHDKLVKAYLEYFKANEWWQTKKSVRAYYSTQKKLREIREISKNLQDENRQMFQEKQDNQN